MRHLPLAVVLLFAGAAALAQPAPPTRATQPVPKPTAADVAAIESIGGGTAVDAPAPPTTRADGAAAASIGGGAAAMAPGTAADRPTPPSPTGITPAASDTIAPPKN